MACCWSHARRKLNEVAKTGAAPIAGAGLKQIAALYRIERTTCAAPGRPSKAAG